MSHDGIARTLYRTHDSSLTSSTMSVEEFYDLQGARKKFLLREDNGSKQGPFSGRQEALSKASKEGIVNLGDPIQALELKEIDEGVFGGAGTGATTWESSIAMSLYFASHPELLHGDVIELGSGVGFGGILCALGGPSMHRATNIKSMTLTDYNPLVLEQCKKNVEEAYRGPIPLNVSRLDWYDFVRETQASEKEHAQKYDTVIACDCAYLLYPDIQALAKTMKALLRSKTKSMIHIFGPHNRAGLHELVRQLREETSVNLTVEGIDMQRYRLKPPTGWNNLKFSHLSDHLSESSTRSRSEKECPFAAKYDAKFLHVTCSLPAGPGDSTKASSISEID
jgi:predicted nicotinamide N-methyase